MTWFCQHNTEAEAVLELGIRGIAAMLAPEEGTCLSVDESISLPNIALSKDDNNLVATC